MILDAYDFKNFYQLIEYSKNQYANKIYINPSESYMPAISFNQLLEFVKKFDNFLSMYGINAQDKVAVVLPNTTLHVLILLAVIGTNRVHVPINPKMGNSEIQYILQDAKPSLIIHSLGETKNLDWKNIEQIHVDNEKKFFEQILTLPLSSQIDSAATDLVAEIV